MKSNAEKGFEAEAKAFLMLKDHFDEVELYGGHSPIDILAILKDKNYLINVKSGKAFHITRGNIINMLALEGIPSFLFAIDDGCYLFSLVRKYPSINNIELSDSDLKNLRENAKRNRGGKTNKRVYVTLRSPEIKNNSGFTIYDYDLEEVCEKIKGLFKDEPT